MPNPDDFVLVHRDDLRELLLDAVTLEKRTTHERRRSLWAAVNGEATTVEYGVERDDTLGLGRVVHADTRSTGSYSRKLRPVVVWRFVGPRTTQETP